METLMELIEDCSPIIEDYTKIDENINRAKYLESLGFKKLADKIVEMTTLKDKLSRISKYRYIRITSEKIMDFLDRKAKKYNKSRVKMEDDFTRSYNIGGLRAVLKSIDPEIIKEYESARAIAGRANMHLVDPRLTLTSSIPYIISNDPNTKIIIQADTKDYFSNDPNTIGRFTWEEERIENYNKVPPNNVLNILKMHQDRALFDYFTIASVSAIHDPLLLGRINNYEDRFFIAQWGEDISLDDII